MQTTNRINISARSQYINTVFKQQVLDELNSSECSKPDYVLPMNKDYFSYYVLYGLCLDLMASLDTKVPATLSPYHSKDVYGIRISRSLL